MEHSKDTFVLDAQLNSSGYTYKGIIYPFKRL
jgi:hypothetical protein